MGAVYFTIAGIVLYLFSDWVVRQIEQARGELLPHRSLIFFAIILTLAMGGFHLIEQMVPPEEQQQGEVATEEPQTPPNNTDIQQIPAVPKVP